MVKKEEAAAAAQAPKQQFSIQRLYVKDFSFESPAVPEIFKDEWKPEMNLDINTNSKRLEDKLHEVVLTLTVTVKSNDQVAFVAEVKHGGIFTIEGFEEEQLKHTLGSFCPSLIYPYARERISDAVTQGGFPQLVLQPINFEALYSQHLKQQTEEKK